jgi:hypothetical protein
MRALEQNEGFEAALRALPMSCEWLVPDFSVICNERVMREGRDPLEIVPKTEEEKQQIFPRRPDSRQPPG